MQRCSTSSLLMTAMPGILSRRRSCCLFTAGGEGLHRWSVDQSFNIIPRSFHSASEPRRLPCSCSVSCRGLPLEADVGTLKSFPELSDARLHGTARAESYKITRFGRFTVSGSEVSEGAVPEDTRHARRVPLNRAHVPVPVSQARAIWSTVLFIEPLHLLAEKTTMAGMIVESRNMQAFRALESNVCAYSRSFPAIFSRARGSIMLTEDGRKIIDFFSGAGALNYGHNNHQIKAAIMEYLAADAVVHGLDMATPAKLKFMETFSSVILRERGLRYRFQFTGPTGANAVEAALKLSRKVTGRQNVISFTHGYHGMSLGAIAASGNRFYRRGSGVSLSGTTFTPYDGYLGPVDTADYLRKILLDKSSGIDTPAAILVETVQGEGGINVARKEWLQSIQAIAKDIGAIFIVDDIQMGCGRTGEFFSFEFATLSPDLVVMSKSLSAYGLPLSMLLIKEELDVWQPGEHSGTFRGNNLALVSATAAIDIYWRSATFPQGVQRTGELLRNRLEAIASEHGKSFAVRGRGMVLGFDCQAAGIADATTSRAFEKGLMIERCGPEDQVIKFLPALTIDHETLNQGIEIFEESLKETLQSEESLVETLK